MNEDWEIGKEGNLLLKLKPATPEVVARYEKIKELHKIGKLDKMISVDEQFDKFKKGVLK